MKLRMIFFAGPTLGAVLLFTGCHIPSAEITTVQDPKYPIGKQSKIGFPTEPQVPNVKARLATEFAQEQLRAMGYTIVPPDQADYIMHMDELARDLSVAEPVNDPSMSTAIGANSNSGVFTGIGFGIPLGPPQAITIHRTELNAVLETAQSPRIVVWQGKILTETEDANEYHSQFFRYLLSKLGFNFAKTIRLDKPDEAAPVPHREGGS